MDSRLCLIGLTLNYLMAVAVAHVATSHQSVVSGEGWRYGYSILSTPDGHGLVTGESYPHGYGGFGTYAPQFAHYNYHKIPESYYLKIPQYLIPPPILAPIGYQNGLNLPYNQYSYITDDY